VCSYQFNSDLYNPDVIVNILLKALTQAPAPDFALCLALLDDRPPTAALDEPDPLPALLPQLQALHALLAQCRFPAFWAAYASDECAPLRDNYTVEVAGFEDAVRDGVVAAVKATFTRIGLARLGSYLDLEGNGNDCYSETDLTPESQALSSRPTSQNSDGLWTSPQSRSRYHPTRILRSSRPSCKRASSSAVRIVHGTDSPPLKHRTELVKVISHSAQSL
jgi:hypothetical protein